MPKALDFCRNAGILSLIEGASAIIVGFSGGADSTVLLSFFADLRKDLPNLQIIAAHVNHMIRGDEADRDENFCKDLCTRLGIPLEVAHIDIPALCEKTGKGTEEAAREERYAFFEKLSEKYENSLIATAHNADDNLETLIFHIARGSGTKGLSGIAPIREKKLIRPLLSCTSDEIRAFAKEKDICYVTDSTNLDTLYTRNSIRREITPLLYKLNPRVCDAALRLSESARTDCDFIEKEAERIVAEGITRERLASLHPALFQRALLSLFKKKSGRTCDLSEKNVKDCRSLVLSTKSGSISLPQGLAFFADKNEVFMEKDPKYCEKDKEVSASPILLQEDIPLCFSDFCILLSKNGNYVNIIDENVYKLSLHESLDYGRINGKLWIRTRRAGDTVKKGNMTKKLKKLLCDADVPVKVRETLPIAEDSEGIVFVPYVGLRDNVSADKNTEKVLNIYIFKKERTTL